MPGFDRTYIQQIVKSVIRELEGEKTIPLAGGVAHGVFDDVDEAVSHSGNAQKKWKRTPIETKKKIIEALRKTMHEYAEDFAGRALLETGMGRLEDKIAKHHNAADATPGIGRS